MVKVQVMVAVPGWGVGVVRPDSSLRSVRQVIATSPSGDIVAYYPHPRAIRPMEKHTGRTLLNYPESEAQT